MQLFLCISTKRNIEYIVAEDATHAEQLAIIMHVQERQTPFECTITPITLEYLPQSQREPMQRAIAEGAGGHPLLVPGLGFWVVEPAEEVPDDD